MTKNENIAQAFRNAKPFLKGNGKASSQTSFICFALSAGNDDYYMRQNAKEIIRQRIAPHVSVSTWLRKVANIPKDKLTSRNIQAYRHSWLDSLIEEFSTKE